MMMIELDLCINFIFFQVFEQSFLFGFVFEFFFFTFRDENIDGFIVVGNLIRR